MRGNSASPWRLCGVSGAFVGVLYAAFGLTDMLMSLAAFALGVPEANPVVVWLQQCNLFIPAKVALTALAAGLMAWVYPRRKVQPVVWSALLTMAGVDFYHIWGLSLL